MIEIQKKIILEKYFSLMPSKIIVQKIKENKFQQDKKQKIII